MTRFAPVSRFLVAAFAIAAVATPSVASAQTVMGTFAMLPLVAGDTGVPYQIFASKNERGEYGASIAAGIRKSYAGVQISDARVARALTKAGIDQESPYRACNDADCARRIGRSLHADTVVFGSVTRALSMIWGSEVSIVEVASGRVQGPYDLGYKGDFLTLKTGVGELSAAVSNRLIADAVDRNRGRTMARR